MHIVQRKAVRGMVMGWIWAVILFLSIISSFIHHSGASLSSSIMAGAQSGINMTIAMAGSILLWSGTGRLMDKAGVTMLLSRLLRPFLNRVFPDTRNNQSLANHLSANICANFLGLGNAATPMGIQAARELFDPRSPGVATDQLCRLVVLNTASIQLIPANVAAVRAGLGCATPFDILPAVWLTSLCSAGIGLLSAWILGKLWKHD